MHFFENEHLVICDLIQWVFANIYVNKQQLCNFILDTYMYVLSQIQKWEKKEDFNLN